MRKVQITSICVLIITLVVMGVNRFIFPLSNWIIRIDGIIMMVGILAVSYSTLKCMKKTSY